MKMVWSHVLAWFGIGSPSRLGWLQLLYSQALSVSLMTSKLVALVVVVVVLVVVVVVVVLVVEVVVLVVEVVVLVVEIGLDCPSLRCWLWRGARCRAAVGKETSASVVWSLFPCTGGSSRWAGAWPRRRSGITVVGSTARPPARPHLHRRAAYSTAFAHCSKPNQTKPNPHKTVALLLLFLS